jgi:1-acyl-sn-glycerol-3-phosphate acyltransferase
VVYNAPLRSFLRLSLYLSWCLSCIVLQCVLVLLRLPQRRTLPMVVHRVCIKIIGAKIIVRGKPVRGGGVIFAANHNGYADISVIGGLLQASFVAKAEVASWPIFGWCAKLSGCVFVDRRARFAMKQAQELKERLKAGDSIIMFPEGTSTDGSRVLRFRSSLFSAAEIEMGGAPVTVQPVSIAYTRLDGIPVGRHLRPFLAWYGDMDMAGHLWQLCGIGRVTAEVTFHDPVTIADFPSRKALASYCEAVVRSGLSSSISGRDQPVFFPPGVTPPARLGGGALEAPVSAPPGSAPPANASAAPA